MKTLENMTSEEFKRTVSNMKDELEPLYQQRTILNRGYKISNFFCAGLASAAIASLGIAVYGLLKENYTLTSLETIVAAFCSYRSYVRYQESRDISMELKRVKAKLYGKVQRNIDRL